MGYVQARTRRRGGARLCVHSPDWSHIPARGDSVSVNGCCLTVVERVDPKLRLLQFDVVPETLGLTTLGTLRVGDRVNLEHAATLATFLGGHLVQGHIDGVASVLTVTRPAAGRGTVRRSARGAGWRIRFGVPPPRRAGGAGARLDDLMQYIPPKGSVCIDGVSLTIASVFEAARAFEVALIPETLDRTTLSTLRRGDRVNLEVDAMTKTIVWWLRRFGHGT